MKMDNNENKNMFDLGSDDIDNNFDPFALDNDADEAATTEVATDVAPEQPQAEATAPVPTPEPPKTEAPVKAVKTTEPKVEHNFDEKPPVFEYAGATENIDDTSKTFDELRIEKSGDFPELEDGKRVSWTVEYGKITKTVADPKGTSIGKMKTDIETSKEFTDSLKRAKDKTPVCKIKPRVTAQSKGTVSAYKGIFPTMDDALSSGKLISLFPARDGRVYEMRNTEAGRFITQSFGNLLLSDVKAGFTPALPPVPFKHLLRIIDLFRKVETESGNEVLVNLIYDKADKKYLLDIPEQISSPISVDSTLNPEYESDRYVHFADIHSHCRMRAYFSATDDRDEKATRVYIVVGNIHKSFPEIKVRISNGGTFLEIEPSVVFDDYKRYKKLATVWSKFKRRTHFISGMLAGAFGRMDGDDE
jgi:hypothetical protein